MTSKLWNTYHAAEHVEAAARRSLVRCLGSTPLQRAAAWHTPVAARPPPPAPSATPRYLLPQADLQLEYLDLYLIHFPISLM